MKTLVLILLSAACAHAQTTLFDGTDFGQWTLQNEKGWSIAKDGSMVCNMGETLDRRGNKRVGSLGFIWSKAVYGDFDLRLEYKLSEAANSGVFYRSDPKDHVQAGLEIQLADDEGFQKAKGKKPPRKWNGAFYDAAAPLARPNKAVGDWNTLRLRCAGPAIQCWINGEKTVDVDIRKWDTPGKNPDGTDNKFKRSLKDFPRTGHIGFQNHGQVVWFRKIEIEALADADAIDSQSRIDRTPQEVLDALLNHYGKRYAGSYLQALALIVRAQERGPDAVAPILAPSLGKAPKPKSGGQLSGRLAFVGLAESDPRARQRVIEAANLGLDAQGKAKTEMPFHNQMSDAVFMACPILCEAGRLTGKSEYYEAAWNHLGRIRGFCLREDGLYHHSPLDEAAWGRGNGFPALGLSMCLQTVPEDWPRREAMKDMLVAHLTALLPHQDKNGMWHQVVDHPESYAEFTCTCMISVAAIRAMREGWIDEAVWRPAIEKSWRAVKGRVSLDGATLNGCCTGTGKQKSLQAYFERNEINGPDERGGAMALLFASEMKRLAL